jgi:hypothetical protein
MYKLLNPQLSVGSACVGQGEKRNTNLSVWNYYWILREKWFWCNEQDWKNYMEKIKQKKK